MKVAPRRDKLHFSDILYIYIYAYVPQIYILQLIKTLSPVTNGS